MLRAVPRSLLMTFFGAFLRRLGGWIAVADLVALMGDLGLDPQAVRSALSRLKRRGIVDPQRRGGAAGYRLTPRGEAILDAGDARIFGPDDEGAGDWLLVVFSIPEARRALRHKLRARLQWLGLGKVAAGGGDPPARAGAGGGPGRGGGVDRPGAGRGRGAPGRRRARALGPRPALPRPPPRRPGRGRGVVGPR